MSATDWAAIISAGVTGLTAITSVVATSRQANRAIQAAAANLEKGGADEDRRATQALKIRIYATFHGAVDDIIAVAGRTKQQEGEFGRAQSAMLKAAAEVTLVAPKEIGDLADKIKSNISDSIGPGGLRKDVDPQHTIDRDRKKLTKDMRAELAGYQTRPAVIRSLLRLSFESFTLPRPRCQRKPVTVCRVPCEALRRVLTFWAR
jgi:hypothetical protein